MSRYDAKIEVICDNCGDQAEWSPEYVFFDFSGNSGHYDTSDQAFKKWCKSEGWEHRGEDEDICHDCLSAEGGL